MRNLVDSHAHIESIVLGELVGIHVILYGSYYLSANSVHLVVELLVVDSEVVLRVYYTHESNQKIIGFPVLS